MQLIPCEGNQASCEILSTLTGTCSLCAICTGYSVWILRVLFFSLMKAEGKINPFHMLLLFLCAYLYYDSIFEALLVGPSRCTQCFTGMYCKDCKKLHMLTISESSR